MCWCSSAQVLECYCYMLRRQKPFYEKAIARLVDILQEDKESVAALLALATAHILLKQTPKARNHLKRIAKMEYNPADGEDFERAWITLASLYIEKGKYGQAQELLKMSLKHNKSSGKAWELLGLIMEKEQAYRDAADNYEKAWAFGGENNPKVGYELAFNYLKAGRLVDAIDICHIVLRQFPDYPKIKKEILEKARKGIRP
eukprot:GCRY01005355.1.p1 GENE.GCRY01005355.1~~GCRY01005355.1.p1  ORF type:complete len:202 (-),score=58.88 GCRY01005355.1:53-658(-)